MSTASGKTAEDIEGWVKRYMELKSAYQEYCRLGKLIKKAVKGKRRFSVGQYLLTGKWVTRKAHIVPESKYWHLKIEHITGE